MENLCNKWESIGITEEENEVFDITDAEVDKRGFDLKTSVMGKLLTKKVFQQEGYEVSDWRNTELQRKTRGVGVGALVV